MIKAYPERRTPKGIPIIPHTHCVYTHILSVDWRLTLRNSNVSFAWFCHSESQPEKKNKPYLRYIYNIRYIYLGLPWGVGFNMWDFPPTCNSHQNHHHHPPTAPRIVYLFPYESTRDQGIPHDLQIMHELWAVERYQAVLVGVCWVPNSLRVWKPKNPKGGPKIGMFSRNEIFFRWWDEKWIDFAIWDVFLRFFGLRTLPLNIHLTISRSWSLVKVDGNLTTCLWLPVVLKGKRANWES